MPSSARESSWNHFFGFDPLALFSPHSSRLWGIIFHALATASLSFSTHRIISTHYTLPVRLISYTHLHSRMSNSCCVLCLPLGKQTLRLHDCLSYAHVFLITIWPLCMHPCCINVLALHMRSIQCTRWCDSTRLRLWLAKQWKNSRVGHKKPVEW